MKNIKVKVYLFATITALSLSSFLGSYLVLDEILDSAISLGVNKNNERLLANYQSDLKTLRKYNPAEEDVYRKRFIEVQEASLIYQEPVRLVSVLKRSYLEYFYVLFAAVFFVSIVAAFYLSRKISHSYQLLVTNNLEKTRRIDQLHNIDSWQKITASLAHEIKNPLTPIELMATNLRKLSQCEDKNERLQKISRVQTVISEEVARLKDMVHHFSRFSKLPDPQPVETDFIAVLEDSVKSFEAAWTCLSIALITPDSSHKMAVNLDPFLFRQCLLNLVQNAIEANSDLNRISVTWTVRLIESNQLEMLFTNQGKQLTEQQRADIFQVGYSSKSNRENQGLGLSIVKKILLDHNGDIRCVNSEEGVSFKIILPASITSGEAR